MTTLDLAGQKFGRRYGCPNRETTRRFSYKTRDVAHTRGPPVHGWTWALSQFEARGLLPIWPARHRVQVW